MFLDGTQISAKRFKHRYSNKIVSFNYLFIPIFSHFLRYSALNISCYRHNIRICVVYGVYLLLFLLCIGTHRNEKIKVR